MNKDYIISKGGKEIGIAWLDIHDCLLTEDQYYEFCKFIQNRPYYSIGPLCITYTEDFEAFLARPR